MRSTRTGALLALILATPAAARHDETTIEAPDAGFRLTIPEVGWTHVEQRGDAGLTAVAIGPAASAGTVQLAIQVAPTAEDGPEAALAHVRQLRAAIAGDASVSAIEPLELSVGGEVAHGLQAQQAAFGRTFRLHLVFLHARGIQYRIQFHAPLDEFEALWPTAQRVLAGFELIELDDAARERDRLRSLAARCGSEVDWAESWDDAAARARREGRLIVVSVFAQPGFALGNRLDEGVFTDRDVLALMDHRFVGWSWRHGLAAPFVDHDVFGLGANTFGVGLLICSPDGAMLRQLYLVQPGLVAEALRDVLREHPTLAPPPTSDTARGAERIAFLIDSGQLDAARTALDAEPDAFQLARLHRIERNGAAALAALRAAPPGPRTSLEEARIHVGLQNFDEAAAAVERCLAADPDPRTRAEALYAQGVLAWAAGETDRAREAWTALSRELPDEPAAWMAAAALVGPVLDVEIKPRIGWPTEATRRQAVIPDAARDRFDVARATARAVAWLVDAQRSDGGWDVPFGAADAHPAPNAIAMASQAICVTALTRAAREGGHDSADSARRGLERYLDDCDVVRRHPRPVAFMDYTCWASSYGLFCLTTDLSDPAATDRERVVAEAVRLVDDLVRIQAPNGGWSYYISGTVDGTSQGAAMSFTTATVLLALDAARSAGVAVPVDTMNRGFACLASLRGWNGVFEYMRMGTGPHQAEVVATDGAAARGPVCTHALQRGGVVDGAAIAPALELYIEHLDVFGAEARKALMHAGPHGEGSHYLLYDYSTAAEAMRAARDEDLGPRLRATARAAILRELDRCRSADGSFVDNPIIGSAAGTGLAVLTLLDLEPGDAP